MNDIWEDNEPVEECASHLEKVDENTDMAILTRNGQIEEAYFVDTTHCLPSSN